MAETKMTHNAQPEHDAAHVVADAHHGQLAAQVVHTGHPTPLTYFKVAIALCAITAAEVGVFYVAGLGRMIIPVLVILSATKFSLVVMFYMHLKYDTKLFSGFFLGGLALAITVFLVVLSLFYF